MQAEALRGAEPDRRTVSAVTSSRNVKSLRASRCALEVNIVLLLSSEVRPAGLGVVAGIERVDERDDIPHAACMSIAGDSASG